MKVWISYSHQDKKCANVLKESLLYEGIEVDTKDIIKPGEFLIDKITSAIKSADIILVIVSSHSSTNNWQISEIATAMSEEKFIIPILIEKNISFPVFLQYYQYIDFTKRNEYGINIKLLKDALLKRPQLNNTEPFKNFSTFLDNQKNFTDHLIENEKYIALTYRKSIFEKLTVFIVIFTITLSILTIGIIGDFTLKINLFLMGLITGIISGLIGFYSSKYCLKIINRFRLKEADK